MSRRKGFSNRSGTVPAVRESRGLGTQECGFPNENAAYERGLEGGSLFSSANESVPNGLFISILDASIQAWVQFTEAGGMEKNVPEVSR